MRQLDKACVRLGIRARLVEANLTLLAKADNHQVNLADRLIEGGAVLRHILLRDGTIGNVDILGADVDILEELVVYSEVTALLLGAANWVELVERVDCHIMERYLARLMTLHQLAIEAQRRVTRS